MASIFRWESFSPSKRKISLISTLVHRALMICTRRRLNGETERLKKILLGNGIKKILLGNGIKKILLGKRIKKILQPKNVVNTVFAKKIAQFSSLKRFSPEKCSVYLGDPWIGKPSTNLKKEVNIPV